MNQPIQEQKSEEKHKGNRRFSVRRRAVLSVIIAGVALLALPVLAWLYMQRSMETITKVNMPYSLFIGAGDAKSIQQLELSDIDVSGGAGEKEVIFCVYSTKENQHYYLQMAHTTNIGFKYTIYKAEMSENGEISYLGKNYTKRDLLEGSYLNQSNDGYYATDAYHETTYENYSKENVQIAAEPLYWKTTNQETLPEEPDSTEYRVNYYVLDISWEDTVQNNKETDMIYLMAG